MNRKAMGEEEFLLRTILQCLKQHRPVKDCYQDGSLGSHHTRQHDGHAQQRQAPKLHARPQHGLWLWRWLFFRWIQEESHLFSHLQSVRTEQLSSLQDIEHHQDLLISPQPTPVRGLHIAQVELTILSSLPQMSHGFLDVLRKHQGDHCNLLFSRPIWLLHQVLSDLLLVLIHFFLLNLWGQLGQGRIRLVAGSTIPPIA
mmetsp:Transcript_61363/g.97250  ORF Transcript_61363/g.97250 Transcript_61363/m.97250 type:complete len:200 (-) Transcript_61363:1195-1794(-)